MAIIVNIPISPVWSLELNIPSVNQEMSQWCWVAGCQMTLEYYDIFRTQTALVEGVFVLPVNEPLALYNTSGTRGVNHVLNDNGEAQIGQTYFTAGTLSKADIFESIDGHKPILLTMNLDNSGYHMVLIKGYINNRSTNPTIIINNPDEYAAYYAGAADVPLTYLQKRTGYWEWEESLRLEKAGTGGVGIFDGVAISGDDVTYTHPAGARTFSGNFIRRAGSNAYATQWQWRLTFSHTSGDYVAGTFNEPSYPTMSTTWNAPGFSLSTGYSWDYNCQGAIRGELKLSCVDTDGYYHDNTKSVAYIPSTTYPMHQYYAYGELSTSVPEVKAHESITLRNYEIQPGANVTFRAGETINIKENVTIHNGNLCNLIVDSSIR